MLHPAIVIYPGLPQIWNQAGTYVWLAAWVVAFAGVWMAVRRAKR
jgi:hypothetical protein